MKEVTIEVRKDAISIQGAGVGNDIEQAKSLLEQTLQALNQQPKSVFTNEVVLQKPACVTLLLWILFLSFQVQGQEHFRFISTSQFLCPDNSVRDSSNIEEYHNSVEVVGIDDMFIIPTTAEWTNGPVVMEQMVWQHHNDSTIVGFSAKNQIYVEWQRRWGEEAVQVRWHGGWLEVWEFYRNTTSYQK